MPLGQQADLADYFIDKYEVSNEEYRAFVATAAIAVASWRGSPIAAACRGRADGPARSFRRTRPISGDGCELARGGGVLRRARQASAHGVRMGEAARNGATAPGEGVMMPWGYVRPAMRPCCAPTS